jgi:hypothetical protein
MLVVLVVWTVLVPAAAKATAVPCSTQQAPGRKRQGVQGAHLNLLGLFLRTSIPFIWRILSAFLPA